MSSGFSIFDGHDNDLVGSIAASILLNVTPG